MQWIVISPAGPVRYPTQWEAQSTAAAMGWSYRRERLSDQPLGGDDLPAFQCANNECEWVALPVPQPACDECGAPNVAL